MSPTSVTIFLSLLAFDIFFPSSFTYARYDPTPNPKSFMESLNGDSSINNNSSRLVEKRLKFPSLPNSKPNVEDLHHYAGYYRLPRAIGARMFYFFFESRNNESDPVVLWLSGGPGASGSVALFYENGPFHITEDLSLIWNNYGWDKISNIIYVDQPTGTGFSYSIHASDIRHNLVDTTNDLYDFLQAFFKEHHELIQNDFFIIGQSFAGHYGPVLASCIQQENKDDNKIHINLQGLAIGNRNVNPRIQYGTLPSFARRYNLIRENDYVSINNAMLPKCMEAIENCDMGSDVDCLIAFDNCDDMFKKIVSKTKNKNYYDYRKPREGALNYDFSRLENFLNDELVKDSLGVPADIPFVPLSSMVYTAMKGEYMKSYDAGIPAVLAYGIKVFIYVGEFDLICNYVGNMKWVNEMAWRDKEEFRQSQNVPFVVDGNEMGELKSHGPLSFLKAYGAGHMVPMDQPKFALDMIQRWMQGELR